MAWKDVLASVFSRPELTPSLEVVRLSIPVHDLPAALEGFTVVQVSDFHVGNGRWVPVRAPDAACRLRELRPDVVVNTGDFFQGVPPLDRVRPHAAPFVITAADELEGPANLAVLGNHDYYAGDEAVRGLKDLLAGLGVKVLLNETAELRKNGASVYFTGLEEREPCFDSALRRIRDVPRPHIVLVHDADLVQRLPPGVADLIVAGHTHGGQITLPGLTGLVVRRFNGSRYVQGWYRINDNPVYINRGLGCTGLPIRFRARPELTVLQFRR